MSTAHKDTESEQSFRAMYKTYVSFDALQTTLQTSLVIAATNEEKITDVCAAIAARAPLPYPLHVLDTSRGPIPLDVHRIYEAVAAGNMPSDETLHMYITPIHREVMRQRAEIIRDRKRPMPLANVAEPLSTWLQTAIGVADITMRLGWPSYLTPSVRALVAAKRNELLTKFIFPGLT